MSHDPIVIVNGARTPMGGFQGCFASVTAPELGAIAIKEAVARAGLQADDIQEVIMGCVLRQAALKAGLPASTGATTINKLCGSGMKATMFAHDLLVAGSVDIVVSGGMESMTNAPYILQKARNGFRMGHGEIKDHMFLDGLEDAETGRLMGSFAQDMADKLGLSRESMDEFAITSLTRAQKPGNAKPEKIPSLKPAFSKTGTITAANASSISDGASALVLMRESTAKARGLSPLARIVAHSTQSQHPSEFTIAPIGAMEKLLAKTGWSVTDVDLFEINEAFAMVTMAAMIKHNIPHEIVNVHGGACALGHPVGSTGSRIILSLIHALKQYGGKRGIASLCIGGGEATAMAIELI
jgi:acetyl-CoA C-acetyltransferase